MVLWSIQIGNETMSGMMRFKTEKDFQDMLKRSHLRVAGSTAVRARAAPEVNLGPVMPPPTGSALEELFAQQLALTKLPAPVRQYPYLRGSKHTLDFAWPDHMIGVEVQGMVHRIKGTFKNDIKKRVQGLLQGWRVIEVDGDSIREGVAVEWLHQLFEMK